VIETAIVVTIVVGASAFLARRAWITLSGSRGAATGGSCCGAKCPAAKRDDPSP
jgi:hypothetical protein